MTATAGAEFVPRLLEALGDAATPNADIGAATTYRVGGRAAVLAEVRDPMSLRTVGDALSGLEVPVLVLGNGSNLLVCDAGFPGVAIRLGEGFTRIVIEGTAVHAGGAALMPVVARKTAAAGLTGLEWAVGVPGTVGGGVRMNAGGHGSDIAATLRRVHVFDATTGEDATMDAAALALGYRRSDVSDSQIVYHAEFELSTGDAAVASATVRDIVQWRRAHQPGGTNAGSVFTNPDGDSAGRLIEASGCKGLRVGSACVSTKHANFIQADADGRADDVYALMQEVHRRVAEATGVRLHPETRLVGYDRAVFA